MIEYLLVTAENAAEHSLLLHRAAELYNERKQAAWGEAAFLSDPKRLEQNIAHPTERSRTEALLALQHGRVAAAAQLWLSPRADASTVTADLSIPADLLPGGHRASERIGEQLLERCRERALALGHTGIEVWTDHRNSSLTAPAQLPEVSSPLSSAPAPAGTASLAFPETGWGIVAEDPWAALLTRAGFRPGLLTRFSSLRFRGNPTTTAFLTAQGCPTLPLTPAPNPDAAPGPETQPQNRPAAAQPRTEGEEPLAQLAGGGVGPDGYELLIYDGLIPERALAGLAELLSDFNEDNPTAGMASAREEHSAERVAERNRQDVERGLTFMSTLLLHAESGAAAGYSRIEYLPQSPKRLQQDLTMTARAHRGHGFGALVKAANLAAAAQRWPQTEVIATENSDHNAHMLRINIAMGFEQDGAIAGWKGEV